MFREIGEKDVHILIPQAVIHFLLTTSSEVQFQIRSYGICGAQNGNEMDFL
jgi:hypothetical protein